MSINFKNLLLAGTALVAVSGFATQAHALPRILTTGVEWGDTGVPDAGTANPTEAVTGDAVDLVTFDLTVINDNTNDDGGGKNTFALGAVTGTTGDLIIITGQAANLVVTGTTLLTTGNTSNVSISNDDAHDANVTTTFSGAVDIGGNLSITNNESSAAKAVVSNFSALTVDGSTTMTAGSFAGAATVAMIVNGNSEFTDGMTVNGGANAAATATLTLKGATNTGSITLTNGAAGAATLILNGTAAQTVAAKISGDGGITVSNKTGVTFSGLVGAGSNNITIENANAGDASSATFQNTVDVATITLGGANTGTNTLTLDSTTQAFTVTGTVDGTATAGEENKVVVMGGKTVTTASVWGGANSNLDSVSISGSGTKLVTSAALTATNTTIASGATLAADAAVTSIIDGAAAGVGTLQATNNLTVTGNIGATNALAAITVDTGKILTVDGAIIKATAINLSGAASQLALSGTVYAITGNVVATTNGAGILSVADGGGAAAVTWTGNVGSSSNRLAGMTMAGGTADTFTTTGDLYVNSISFGHASDSIKFSGTSVQTVSGAIGGVGGTLIIGTGATATSVAFGSNVTANMAFAAGGTSATLADAADFTGNINGTGGVVGAGIGSMIFGGDSVFTGNVGNSGILGTLTITDGGATQQVVAVDGNVASADTLTLNDNKMTVSGTFTLAAGQTLAATVNSAASNAVYGSVVATGAVSINANSLVNATIAEDGVYYNDGDEIVLVDGSAAGGTGVADLASGKLTINTEASTTNSGGAQSVSRGLVTWAQKITDNDSLILVATRQNLETLIGGDANIGSIGTVFESFDGAATNELEDIIDDLEEAAVDGDTAEVARIAESVMPTVDGAAIAAAIDVGVATQGLVETHIAAVRTGTDMSGMAAGSGVNGWNMWMQGYGKHGSQDKKDGVDGYDADTVGGAVGLDSSEMIDNAVLGVAFNYGLTNADSDNANTTETEVDSYGVSLYGSYDFGSDVFISGQAGYAYNKIEMDRHDVGGQGITAHGETDSNQYSAKIGLGRDFIGDYGLVITPVVSADYMHLKTDGYRETGAGNASLIVNENSQDVAKAGLGVTAAWNLKESDGSMTRPMIHLGYAYDITNDNVESTSAFTGGGGAFQTQGADPDHHQVNGGVGMTYMTTANFDFSANYDYTYKTNYDAHSGVIRMTSHF